MIIRFFWALGVWIIVALALYIVGGLLTSIAQETVAQIGAFLRDNAGIIGFLCGLVYFFFGNQLRR